MSLEIEKLKSLVNVKEGTVSHNSTYMYLHVHKPVIYFSIVVFSTCTCTSEVLVLELTQLMATVSKN